MKYSNEFIALLDSTAEEYVGLGNPNSRILFLGQEAACYPEEPDGVDGRNDYSRSIKSNRSDWRRNIRHGLGYEAILESCTAETLKNYNPLYPYKGQKFQVRSGSEQHGNLKGAEGTSRTWYNYQKLINKIFELYLPNREPMNKRDNIDFHLLSFHSDMSAVVSKKHNHNKKEEAAQSVSDRIELFSSDFFRNFPIVIAAVHNFPRVTYGDEYFGRVFDVEFLGNEESQPGKWMNVSIRNDKVHPMLLIHTPQFSEAISDSYLDRIAQKVVNFAKERQICLMPEVNGDTIN